MKQTTKENKNLRSYSWVYGAINEILIYEQDKEDENSYNCISQIIHQLKQENKKYIFNLKKNAYTQEELDKEDQQAIKNAEDPNYPTSYEDELEYIEKYILPYESDKIKLKYLKGLIEYDQVYIKKHKRFNTLYNEQ